MIVTSVTRIDNRRQKVILDNEYVFSLYNSEIKKYNIELDAVVSSDFIHMLEKEVLYPRAKERALYIIERCDKTKKQIVDKLKESYYPENIIEQIVEFLTSYGYIDDERFAKNYVKMKQSSKSQRFIESELIKKGINTSIIKEAFGESFDDCQLDALRKYLYKDKYKNMLISPSDRQKVIASMLRRGFSYEQITRCIDEVDVNL